MIVHLDTTRMSAAFDRVLVADELLIDARAAVTSAGTPAGAYAWYEPLVDDVVVSRVAEEELTQAVEGAQQTIAVLDRWPRVPSSRLRLAGRSEQPPLGAWDASLRVASSRDCPLWCDDVALRNLAESEGIQTFGTCALYEVLALEQGKDWLPNSTDLKMRLLRASVADVPSSLLELQEAADDSDGVDAALNLFLGRPLSWRDPLEALLWYLKRVSALIAASSSQEIPDLLSLRVYLGSGVVEGP